MRLVLEKKAWGQVWSRYWIVRHKWVTNKVKLFKFAKREQSYICNATFVTLQRLKLANQ